MSFFARRKKAANRRPTQQPVASAAAGQDAYSPFFHSMQSPAPVVRSTKWQIWFCASAIGSGILLAAVGTYWLVQRHGNHFSRHPYVFMEIKTIDDQGYPLAGAEIKIGDATQGVSDTFGEWRRYIKVRRGETLAVKIDKKTEEGNWLAVKNLTVPMNPPSKGEWTLSVSVQLKKVNPYTAVKPAEDTKPAEEVAEKKSEEAVAAEAADTKAATDDKEKMSTKPASVRLVVVDPSVGTALSAAERYNIRIFKTRVLPQVRAELSRQGVTVDNNSPWQVKLSLLSSPQEGGLLLVENIPTTNEPRAFLRNYLNDPKIMAQKLVAMLRFHSKQSWPMAHEGASWFALESSGSTPAFWRMNASTRIKNASGKLVAVSAASPIREFQRWQLASKENPCVGNTNDKGQCWLTGEYIGNSSPKPEWQLKRGRILGKSAQGAQVFIGGFGVDAQAQGSQEFVFWGPSQGPVNITVTRGNQIIHREKRLLTKDQVLSLALPEGRVARR